VALGDAVLLAAEDDDEAPLLALVQAMWQTADGAPPPLAAGWPPASPAEGADARCCSQPGCTGGHAKLAGPSLARSLHHINAGSLASCPPGRLQGGAGAAAGARRGDGAG
jgi:hypothetical protein